MHVPKYYCDFCGVRVRFRQKGKRHLFLVLCRGCRLRFYHWCKFHVKEVLRYAFA